jgi:site-specific DNA-methyltransferase (adenine-specific)
MNILYFGDNLNILRDKIPSDYVDLIYLDPPFKSGKNYNVIFQPELKKIKGGYYEL